MKKQGILGVSISTLMIFGTIALSSHLLFGARVEAQDSAGEESLAEEETVDLKPHFAPFSLVELFVYPDCKNCVEAQKKVNELELAAGTRKGRVMFLTYTMPREKSGVTGVGETEILARESLQKRWESYEALFRIKRRAFPQLVINGGKYLTANKIETLDHALFRGLSRPARAAITIEIGKVSSGTIPIRFEIQGLPKSRSDDLYTLTIAAIAPHRSVPIYTIEGVDRETVWENAILDLVSQRIEEDGNGSVEIHLSEEELRSTREIVAFLQDARTGQPVGGESMKFKLPSKRRSSEARP